MRFAISGIALALGAVIATSPASAQTFEEILRRAARASGFSPAADAGPGTLHGRPLHHLAGQRAAVGPIGKDGGGEDPIGLLRRAVRSGLFGLLQDEVGPAAPSRKLVRT